MAIWYEAAHPHLYYDDVKKEYTGSRQVSWGNYGSWEDYGSSSQHRRSKECTVSGCTSPTGYYDYASHSWSTYPSSSTHTRKICNVCGRIENIAPIHTHVWGEWSDWFLNDLEHKQDARIRFCSCGASDVELRPHIHIWGGWSSWYDWAGHDGWEQRFRQCQAGGNIFREYQERLKSTIPNTPNPPSISNVTNTTATVRWSNVSDASSYTVRVRAWNTDNTYNTTGTPMSLTGLAVATHYRVEVLATNEHGSSPYSATTTFNTLPNKPNLSVSKNLNGTIGITASVVGRCDNVEIARFTGGSTITFLDKKTVVNNGEALWSGLPLNTPYRFSARSFVSDINKWSNWTRYITVTTANKPELWSWSSSFINQTTFATINNKAQVITATEWNEFRAKIIEVADFKSQSVYLDSAISGNPMVTCVNQATNAIRILGGSITNPTIVTKGFFIQLQEQINQIIERATA